MTAPAALYSSSLTYARAPAPASIETSIFFAINRFPAGLTLTCRATMWARGWRDDVWRSLGDGKHPWDLIVVGGGITGAGIVAEAARIGLKVLLLEANDFASGTSSRSTKLVHGGLRYLREGQLRVTRESVVERERLMEEARGLVQPLGFWLTTFEGDKMPGWMFGLGLAM